MPEVVGPLRDLSERWVGVATVADPVRIDSTDPGDRAAQAVAGVLAQFAQMDRSYAIDRATHARTVAAATAAAATGPGWVVLPAQIAPAGGLRDAGRTIAEIPGPPT